MKYNGTDEHYKWRDIRRYLYEGNRSTAREAIFGVWWGMTGYIIGVYSGLNADALLAFNDRLAEFIYTLNW